MKTHYHVTLTGRSLHDSHGAVDDAVMDLVGEDAEGMRKARSDYFWDKKRRRYVKLQKAESVTASGKRVIKNEAGRLVKVKGGGTGEGGRVHAVAGEGQVGRQG